MPDAPARSLPDTSPTPHPRPALWRRATRIQDRLAHHLPVADHDHADNEAAVAIRQAARSRDEGNGADDNLVRDWFKQSTDTPQSQRRFHTDVKRAVIGALITLAIAALGTAIIGRTSGAKALVLLESTIPTARFLCSSVMTVAATTLALMLTLLSLMGRRDNPLHAAHYHRIQLIAIADCVVFIVATLGLIFMSVPVGSSMDPASTWFEVFYYGVLGISAMVGAALVGIVVLLYGTVRDMITIFSPHHDSASLEDGGG